MQFAGFRVLEISITETCFLFLLITRRFPTGGGGVADSFVSRFFCGWLVFIFGVMVDSSLVP
jgi:hypothetical protein